MWYQKLTSQDIIVRARSCHPLYTYEINIVRHRLSTSFTLTTMNCQKMDHKINEILRQSDFGLKERRCWKSQGPLLDLL